LIESTLRGSMPTKHETDIATLRSFNRVYTRQLGLLEPHLDKSPFTLSEARILYELANQVDQTGAELSRTLRLDPAQISRTLNRFVDRGLVITREDPLHGRHQLLSLTPAGHAAFVALNDNTCKAIGGLLDNLPPYRRSRLLQAAETIDCIFDQAAPAKPVLRDLRPGDLGMVTARQAILYAEDYGWNSEYEVLVARILAEFRQKFDPAREAAWIAELDAQMVGSIFLVAGSEFGVGKLRLLYVEPEARGAGVGKALVAACIERAREVGYERLDLWTNSILTAARRIYEHAGFELVDEAPHHSFGHDLIGQTWSLKL
jgi:DNA-binding MarR family transcriptional regulator/GNAT superfamily N-acetyltransferase